MVDILILLLLPLLIAWSSLILWWKLGERIIFFIGLGSFVGKSAICFFPHPLWLSISVAASMVTLIFLSLIDDEEEVS